MQEEMTRLRMAAAGEDGMLITGEARRDAAWFLPPGYAARPEPGSTVLTADLGGGPLALGVPMAQADLLPGEIRLTAGAAMLRLCPDGRVYLNLSLIHISPFQKVRKEDCLWKNRRFCGCSGCLPGCLLYTSR